MIILFLFLKNFISFKHEITYALLNNSKILKNFLKSKTYIPEFI
jgi:hypothetical protein